MKQATAVESYLQSLGRVIRHHRERIALSQEGFALVVGLHRTYVGAVERGESNLTLGSLLRIADALETTPAGLLNESETAADRT